MNSNKKTIEFNRSAHDKIHSTYKKDHVEIYNNVEQERLSLVLTDIINKLRSQKGSTIRCLDYGCGDGNVTSHLVNSNCDVLSCDISEQFLSALKKEYFNKRVETLLINGEDLSEIESSSIDLVVVYSVLHHIPDYLCILDEFKRVLTDGGVLLLDHEYSKSYWDMNETNRKKYNILRSSQKKSFSRFFRLQNYISWLIRHLINKKYQQEGDIHVWNDDHIEWDKIEAKIQEWSSDYRYSEYLLYRGGYDDELYNLLSKNRIYDTGMLVSYKK